MNTKHLAAGIAAALVAAGAAGAFVTGVGFGPGGDGGSDVESFPTETPTATAAADDAADSTDAGDDAAGTTTPPFALSIDSIEECGRTCRDVTSTLTNQQEATAEDVTVYTRIYVGNGTDGDVAWEGTESVGTLEPGGSATATKRVELSYSDAIAVEQNGGWVTVQTTVQTADRTETFTERRQVA